MPNTTKKIVLVTGANSGIGFHACLNIAKQDNYHVILTGRNAERVHAAAEKVRAVASPSSTVEEGILDLSSLVAVEKFANDLKAREDVPEIAAILCNGGLSNLQKELTVDGYEATFAVNHLSHFLLATLLREKTKRLVIISSETHDPAEQTGADLPNVSDLNKLAVGYEPFNGGEAYTTSKLCNLLFMHEWIRRFPQHAELLAYTPGFTPDTSFLRQYDANSIAGMIAMCKQYGVPINTSDEAGAFMSRLVVEDLKTNGWQSGAYFRKDHAHHTSEQAKEAALGKALWDKSEELVKSALAAKN